MTSEAKVEAFQTMLRVLNEAFASDPDAMHALICNRVPCNEALANHPTVQVQVVPRPTGMRFAVGMLGVLSGLSETLTGKRVAAKFSEPDASGVSVVIGFTEFVPAPPMAERLT